MEVISPYMEMATSYISTPYGIAAIAGVILVRYVANLVSTLDFSSTLCFYNLLKRQNRQQGMVTFNNDT